MKTRIYLSLFLAFLTSCSSFHHVKVKTEQSLKELQRTYNYDRMSAAAQR